MLTGTRCNLCGKKTYSLQLWFEKMICGNCYEFIRARSQLNLSLKV